MADARQEKTKRRWRPKSPLGRALWRIGVAIVGGAVLTVGIILIPYPGPGWLVVFGGLAILATEFAWAKRVLTFTKARYNAWSAWLKRQPVVVRLLILLLVFAIVLATLWLLNAFALVGHWAGVDWPWLGSPLFA